jgi:hypothetical protein
VAGSPDQFGIIDVSAEWDEPRVELLKRLWLNGETARTIAEELGQGATRNAVIGKAHRLGLTGKQGTKRAGAPAPNRPSAPKKSRSLSKR